MYDVSIARLIPKLNLGLNEMYVWFLLAYLP